MPAMSENPFDPVTVAQLPERLAIFPLAGATLLPRTQLPLNIFEPRYLNMVLDALGAQRMIGMVQPDPRRPGEEPEATYRVGCAGRIVAFNETGDGRLLINLQGVCRFGLGEELPLHRGYRRVLPQWDAFASDLATPEEPELDRASFRDSLAAYLDGHGLRVDWDSLQSLPAARMVDFLAMHLPLAPEEKQALLEAPGPGQRARDLVTVTTMAVRPPPGGTRH